MNLTYKAFRARYMFVVGFSLTVWSILIGRLFYIQVLDGRELSGSAITLFEDTVELPPLRGNFFDRNGKALTGNTEHYTFAVRPAELADRNSVARHFSRYFERSTSYYLRQMNKGDFVYLERNVPLERCAAFLSAPLPAGVEIDSCLRRTYPYAEVAAPLIGLVGTDNEGLTGLEALYEAQLMGTPGIRTVGSDGRGQQRIRGGFDYQPPINGNDCHLTIDIDLQIIVEEEIRKAMIHHDARRGMAVLLHPATGELLAIASLPGFDPNSPDRIDAANLKVHPIVSTFEPGSTFKVIGATACLSTKAVDPMDKFDCENGTYKIYNITISDWRRYQTLTFAEVIQNSSNIGTIKAVDRVPEAVLFDFARDFGFSERTGITFPGEASGSLKRVEDWSGVSKSEISIGYEISVTALQMAMAYGAIANDGILMRPRLVQYFESPRGAVKKVDKVFAIREVAKPEVMHTLSGILKCAVEKGTGTKAFLPYMDIAGKTGTAKKLEDGRYVDKYVASFASYFPAHDPIYALVVVIDQPSRHGYTGGQVAAPVAREIFRRIQGLRAVSPTHSPEMPTENAPVERKTDKELAGQLLSSTMPVMKAGHAVTEMPELRGSSLLSALQVLSLMGVDAERHGSGRVIRQVPAPGTRITPETTVKLYLSE